jgi:competence protein ComEC
LNRVLKAAKELNIREFDVIETTHYDVDHAGNIPALAAQIPGKLYVDHGPFVDNPKIADINRKAGEAYLAFVADKKRMSVKPGDVIPLKGVKVTVVTSGEAVLHKPLPGAGKANAACPATPTEVLEADDNSGSIGTIWEFGKFRMGDFGDLLHWVENRAVCPTDMIGKVDLFLVNHHGVNLSNSPEFLAALQPKVSIMNNGERKGGAPEVFKNLRGAPRFQDVWQAHYSTTAGEDNAKEDFIANMKQKDCQGFAIKVSARKDGSFTVTNLRNNFTKTYK